MGRHHYHFVSHWRVAGNVEEVSAVFRDGQDLARWWPAVYLSSTVVDPGDESGLGYTVALQSKGFLPYTIRWWAKATEVRHPYGYTIETSGDFVGRGVWTFAQDGDSVNIDYDWRIVADKPLLRYGAAVLKPLYAFNHHWAMARGAESLARELERRRARTPEERALIAPPPGPSPLTARAVVLAGAGMAVFALAVRLLGRR